MTCKGLCKAEVCGVVFCCFVGWGLVGGMCVGIQKEKHAG